LLVGLGCLLLGGLVGWAVANANDFGSLLPGSDEPKRAATVNDVFEPDDTKLDDCKQDDADCYEQAVGNMAYKGGAQEALGFLAKHVSTGDIYDTYCHRLTHAAGAGTLLRNKDDVGKTFAEGDSTCWSGYYHGVLERAFGDATDKELAPLANKLCVSPEVKTTNFLRYQCVHGLGHGLMLHTAYDLPRALKVCETLEDPWESTSCDSGVFMENIASTRGATSKYVRDDDPIYPCADIAERHKLYCYLMVTSRINELNGYDWEDTAKTCLEDAETQWRDTCFQSYGRDASGQSRRKIGPVVDKCAIVDDEHEDECVWGAVRDMVSEDAGPDRAAKFCRIVPEVHTDRCFDGLGTIVADQQPDDASRKAECRRVASDHLDACFGGARVA
jgi:hypothetical protein